MKIKEGKNMNKWLLRFFMMILMVGLVTGCVADQDESQETTNSRIEQTENEDTL